MSSLGGRLAGGDSRRNVEAIALLALVLTISTFSLFNLTSRVIACFPGDIGTTKCPLQSGSHDIVALGLWKNFPASCTSSDSCEMMNGNQTHRGILLTQTAGTVQGSLLGELDAVCITPSNTVGATLQLQEAIFSSTTDTNTTNFSNLGSPLPIDGSVPCPGDIAPESATNAGGQILPAITGSQYMVFRVIGNGGGGIGDNPRFGSVSVMIAQRELRLLTFSVSSRSTTSFTTFGFMLVPSSASVTASFEWIATNSTAASCVSLNVCIQHGNNSCSITAGGFTCNIVTTFATAFSATPDVVVSPAVTVLAMPSITFPVASIEMLTAQTVTV